MVIAVPDSSTGNMSDLQKKNSTSEKGRQSYSCAECRRLKLKCSRVWPCTSCEKRGCAQICPKGVMKTGKGKRLILADTEELHHRISLLEVALAQSHAISSTTPHPLLASPYLFAPRSPGVKDEKGLEVMEDEEDRLEGGLGALTISAEGQARFVGSFAGSEYLRGESGESADEGEDDTQHTGTGLATPPPSARMPPHRTLDILTGRRGQKLDIEQLRKQLPDWETEGRALVESYWENVNWMYQILPRPMFDGDHLLNAYDEETPANAPKVACVFLLMAIGVMFDLNRGPYHPRGAELYALGQDCINAGGLERPNPATVQALHLSGTYVLNDKRGNGAEIFWPMLGTAVKIAQSLGLHRDGTAFGLSQYEIEERRQVWWELVVYDRLQALCFGRPCATSHRSSDTQFPDPEMGLSGDADGYHRAKYRLITMMEKVIDVQTQTTPVSVQQVAALDKEFRQFKNSVPEALLPSVPIQSLPLDPSVHPHLIIHRLGLRLLTAQSRLLLNRPLFARALKDSPDDPSQGKFGESFMGLYESAQEIVQIVKQLVIYHPSLIARWWFFWFHAFTSSVCLAAIAIHSPNCAFASPAFHGMTIVCDISAAARPGCRAKKGLPILRRLRERASQALTAARKQSAPFSAQPQAEDDDLSHLHTSATLRRVGNSPPASDKASLPRSSQGGGGGSTGFAIDPSESPVTPHSDATSNTLVEPMHYDPMTGGLAPMTPMTSMFNTNLRGAVAPPPSRPQDLSVSDVGSWLNVSPMNHNNNLTSDLQWPGSTPDSGTGSGSGSGISTQSPGGPFMDSDISMALGIDRAMIADPSTLTSPQGQVAGSDGFEGEFDFESFVNSMGTGDLWVG